MAQTSKHSPPRKLWKHYFDITISRLHLQDALNRYWSSAQIMTINGTKTKTPTPAPTAKISFDDYLSLSEITFEWGDSYDDKDWDRLRKILAPTLMIDYSEVNGHKWMDLPSEEFVGIMSHPGFLGDPLIHTQHHIGASKWQKISGEEVLGHHQLRAAHQRYTGPDKQTVENKGHGHAMIKHWYRKIDGQWKLAGLRPTVRWNEFEFEKIFKGGF
ncbi:hypothetical protein MMC07_002281 [Pseudocyphellaria aurata]|nr:hypothetical protein [Pseudocyphellaria aurata]